MNTQDEHLDYILDRCIERIASGESVSSCLASYPDDREELEPLLRIAAVTMQAVSAVEPNQVAKARGLRMLNEAVAERTAKKNSFFGWLTSWRSRPRGRRQRPGRSPLLGEDEPREHIAHDAEVRRGQGAGARTPGKGAGR